MAYRSLRTNTTSTSPALWNPRDVLELVEDGRCVGWAPSKGRKCMNFIAGHNLTNADNILHDISTCPPKSDSHTLRSRLECLAVHGLCVRWHQNQAQEMVRKWLRRIEQAYPENTPRRIRSSRIHTPETTLADHPVPARATHYQTGSQDTELAELLETIRSTQRRVEEILAAGMSQDPPSQAVTLYRSNSSAISSRRSPVTTDRSAANIQYETPRPSAPNASFRRSTSNSASSALEYQPSRSSASSRVSTSDISSLHLSRSSSARTCRRNHVPRRRINEECAICQEDDHMSSCSLSELVWCKAQCGRSVHAECFAPWRDQARAQGRNSKCIYCRAEWVDCEEDCGYEWVSDSEDDQSSDDDSDEVLSDSDGESEDEEEDSGEDSSEDSDQE